MSYHIDTGLIKEKFKVDCECPLCQIREVAEEQFLHEFLNDAVMEDRTRAEVNEKGFCAHHFDMLFSRQNKLSLALQISTRVDTLRKKLKSVDNPKGALKLAEEINKAQETCVICDLLNDSMVKYYKTIAQMFKKEPDFKETLLSAKGFCLEHYKQLLIYAKYAGSATKDYLKTLSLVEEQNFARLREELNTFCVKHDYRNALMPLGKAENILPRMRIKLYEKAGK